MTSTEKLHAYLAAFSELDADSLLSTVTDDFRTFFESGKSYGKLDLPDYVAGLKKEAPRLVVTDLMVEGNQAWIKWRLGERVGAGLIKFGLDGVSEEQLFLG